MVPTGPFELDISGYVVFYGDTVTTNVIESAEWSSFIAIVAITGAIVIIILIVDILITILLVSLWW